MLGSLECGGFVEDLDSVATKKIRALLDFFKGLLKTTAGHDSVWVIVDRLTNQLIFYPSKPLTPWISLLNCILRRLYVSMGFLIQSYPTEILASHPNFGRICKRIWEHN